MGTGTNSMTSSNDSHYLEKESIRENLELNAGITRLLRLNGVKSLKRNLQTEDESYERSEYLLDNERFGTEKVDHVIGPRRQTLRKEEEMEVMAARDVHLHHPPQPQLPQPSQFAKMAGAALLASAIGLPAAAVAWKFLDRPIPPPLTNTDNDTIRGIRIIK